MRAAGVQDEGILEKVNGSLNGHSVAVKIVPMLRTSGNTGIETKVFVGVSVNASAVRGIGAGMFTGADSFAADLHRAGTDPLKTWRTIFTAGFTEEGKGRTVSGADRRTVFIESGIGNAGSLGVSCVERNAGSFKVEIVHQDGVVLVGIKGGISDEGFEREMRMRGEEVRKDGLKGSRIADFLIDIGRIGLWGNDIGVFLFEVVIEEFDVARDTETVGEDTELQGIAEMTVDVLLLCVGIRFGDIRQEGINAAIGIVVGIAFSDLFRLLKFFGHELGIVFGDGQFDAGCIVDQVIRLFCVDLPADGFRNIDQIFKHGL